ncbi:ribosome-inactivating family protein [Yersinia enterocolitica]|uniref:ribosome-inactivating family protein n=1 Tax=Yersinia enterocolitica TaxID=630 RepID=UPI0038B7527E
MFMGNSMHVLLKLFFLFMLVFSVSSNAQEFTIDFSSPKKYVDSLNYIRSAIGSPITSVSYGETSLMRITPQVGDGLLLINVRGLDSEEERFNNLQLVIVRDNLYVAGFVNRATNTFYRFSDFSYINIPVSRVVTFSSNSSYTALQRAADLSREGMQINRHSLVNAYLDLVTTDHTEATRSVARAMLRFITVTSEALRFRQIQREFRVTLDSTVTSTYVMSQEDIELTLNWDRLSTVLSEYHGNEQVRVGRVDLNGVSAVLAAVAVILNCQSHPSLFTNNLREWNKISEQCKGRVVKINNTLWDSSTLTNLVLMNMYSTSEGNYEV